VSDHIKINISKDGKPFGIRYWPAVPRIGEVIVMNDPIRRKGCYLPPRLAGLPRSGEGEVNDEEVSSMIMHLKYNIRCAREDGLPRIEMEMTQSAAEFFLNILLGQEKANG
jgi:hypothetical protein